MTIYTIEQRLERAASLCGTNDIESALPLISDLRKQKILCMRLGFGCEPSTYAEIEAEIGVTRERVRQMEKEAFKEIRRGLSLN